jgi:hypothetical protein
MRKSCALVLLVLFSWLGGLEQDARAGVTIDVLFQDETSPSGITILAGDPGPGCTFSGYYGRSVTAGYCMDVMLYTTDTLIIVGASIAYDSDNGLSVASFYEWKGVGVSFNKQGTVQKECTPPAGVTDNGSQIGSFDCVIPPPNLTTPMAAGTYRIGTIVWDTSATTVGTERIWVVDAAASAVINGNIIDVSSSVVLGSAAIGPVIPEPGTAALLGLGLVGLLLTARRRRSPSR